MTKVKLTMADSHGPPTQHVSIQVRRRNEFRAVCAKVQIAEIEESLFNRSSEIDNVFEAWLERTHVLDGQDQIPLRTQSEIVEVSGQVFNASRTS